MKLIKIGAGGEPLAAGADKHVAVLDEATGLMWTAADASDKALQWKAANEAAKNVDLLGHADWRLPTRAELLTLVDDARHRPAIDTAFFPTTKSDWYWSSSPFAADPEYGAWGVYFGNGGAFWNGQNNLGFVRAVRSVVSVPGQ